MTANEKPLNFAVKGIFEHSNEFIAFQFNMDSFCGK